MFRESKGQFACNPNPRRPKLQSLGNSGLKGTRLLIKKNRQTQSLEHSTIQTDWTHRENKARRQKNKGGETIIEEMLARRQ